MLGTDFILNGLEKEGINHLFMIPGGLIDPFLQAFSKQKNLKPIVAAQEGGAAYMADGYARASKKFGAVLCIGGPGLTNTVTAIATALTDGSPVLLLSGEASTEMEGLGMFQDASSQTLNDVDILKGLTNYSSSIDNPKNLSHIYRKAMLHMRSIPNGPVHLSIPKDSQLASIDVEYTPINDDLTHTSILSEGSAQESLQCFLGNPLPTRIVILAGAGVEHANSYKALLEFSEKWNIPVATTLRAKGVFPEDHPLSLGVFGYAGTLQSKKALLDDTPDLLIILGSGLNERDTMHWTLKLNPKKTLCINSNVMALESCVGAHCVVGDVGAYLNWLSANIKHIQSSLESTQTNRKKWISEIKALPRLQNPENCKSSAVPIHPARVISELRKALPRDGILVVDSGAHRAFAGHYWESYEPLTYISATNLGPMGWAIPAAVGIQCALPNKKVAVITGDGCMHMHGLEVATAARYKLPIVYVVINNAALGNVWLRAHKLGPIPDELTSLPDIDWASFSRSLGGNGITVNRPDELASAFTTALNNVGPTVIDVKADKNFPTPVKEWAEACAAWSYQE
jgi:acetolactate synthase-1/2/3 large subunit